MFWIHFDRIFGGRDGRHGGSGSFLQFHLNDFARLATQVLTGVFFRIAPHRLTGLGLRLPCFSVGSCKASLAGGQRNGHQSRVLVQGSFLVSADSPMQNSHVFIFKRDFALLRRYLRGVLRQDGSKCQTWQSNQDQSSMHRLFPFKRHKLSLDGGNLLPNVFVCQSKGCDACDAQPGPVRAGGEAVRSEERRVGKECRCRWWWDQYKKKQYESGSMGEG